jgi:hypothetical protein
LELRRVCCHSREKIADFLEGVGFDGDRGSIGVANETTMRHAQVDLTAKQIAKTPLSRGRQSGERFEMMDLIWADRSRNW